jgi:hypothetical protein
VVRRQWSNTSRRPLPDRARAWDCCANVSPHRCSRIGFTHTHAQARPSPRGGRPDLLHGHDSLHDVIRSDVRGRMSDRERVLHGPPVSVAERRRPCRSRTPSDICLATSVF